MKKINNLDKNKIKCGFFPAFLAASSTTKWGMITAITSGISLFTSLASSVLNIATNSSEEFYNYREANYENPKEISYPSYISSTIKPIIKIF